jgi:hypothetical protein
MMTTEIDPAVKKCLEAILTVVDERRHKASQQTLKARRDRTDALQKGQKNQATVYDASAICFNRLTSELTALRTEIAVLIEDEFGAGWGV